MLSGKQEQDRQETGTAASPRGSDDAAFFPVAKKVVVSEEWSGEAPVLVRAGRSGSVWRPSRRPRIHVYLRLLPGRRLPTRVQARASP